ncbi:hypothetical protein AMS68_007029 [Peltaster fructicola]|uniref:Altered inheritance of mitochondria protein 32 n=1 Tax=Peltaster fructicola TaxID=286661 RepID=A0A6H0Y3C1_9PEZI|nr:hypothetical protein AMS68_007029 [Peltaster fructicola]
MPGGLEIDHEKPLGGTMPAYAEQVLISTGKGDWNSKIEDDTDGKLVRHLRSFIAPKGKYSNPFHNVMLTHSSFAPPERETSTSSAYLFPSFRYIPSISLEPAAVEDFVKAFVLPVEPPAVRGDFPTPDNIALRQPELQTLFRGVRDVEEIVVLICSHGSRDSRCGVLGPILKAEFEEKLEQHGIDTSGKSSERPRARVGLISHIGGHRWAGNVIIYLPPQSEHPLAGTGVWYGRVAPEHVEGIVRQTVLNGKIIENMFRGGIDQNRNILRL